jgi:hypothetical protein
MFPFDLREKKFRMVWEVRKGHTRSFLAGTAHFFPYSFKKSLIKLIKDVDVVLFEGPLDEGSMSLVRVQGLTGSAEDREGSLYHALDETTKKALTTQLGLAPPQTGSSFESYMGLFGHSRTDPLYEEISGLRPWLAFFRLWTRFLAAQHWRYSVDLDALSVAKELSKEIVYLETIEEQVGAMEGIPFDGIVSFVKDVANWKGYIRNHAKNYLAGELGNLTILHARFPTRCESIVDRRDQVFFERMKDHLYRGNAISFIGTSHVRGVSALLAGDGCRVVQCKR